MCSERNTACAAIVTFPMAMTKMVRERSAADGPCTILGPLLREADWYISYRDRRDGTRKFISKRWPVHTDPCPSCPDHPKSKYPDERWD